VADDALFVNNEGRAASNEPLLVEDTVSLHHLALEVAQKRESHPNIFLEPLIGRVAVNTDAQDLRVALLEIGDISLIRLQLLSSTTREGEHVKGQGDVLLTTEIREPDRIPLRVRKSEVGGRVTNLEVRLRGTRLGSRSRVTVIRA
jgi:hypothetical protein